MVVTTLKTKADTMFCRGNHGLFSGMSEIIFASLCRHGFINVLNQVYPVSGQIY
jgi:hypothetical protein